MKNKEPAPVQATPVDKSNTFPWHRVPKKMKFKMAATDNISAIECKVQMGSANVAICRELHVGWGNVDEAIVFDKVRVNMGNIDHLHCLRSTQQRITMGAVEKVTYYDTVEELVAYAMQKANLEPSNECETDIPVAMPLPYNPQHSNK